MRLFDGPTSFRIIHRAQNDYGCYAIADDQHRGHPRPTYNVREGGIAVILSAPPERQYRSGDLVREISRLAQTASLELNVQDTKHLIEVRTHFEGSRKLYVSHLPKQRWEATCTAIAQQGFEPVPHLPARLLESREHLDRLLGQLCAAGTQEALLISGDYPSPVGPFSQSSDVIATGLLAHHGFQRVSIAGHPEGHLKVPLSEIRSAERAKAHLADEHGLEASFVTQFLFEPEPFIEWAAELRRHGVRAPLRCGLAGPAKITTLLHYATRCGVGASIRALGTHSAAISSALADRGPDEMLRALAESRLSGSCDLHSVHLSDTV
jgi:methylenetetrahydrofolate reductase (NADPH)